MANNDVPRRDDKVAAWLKEQRDLYPSSSIHFMTIDWMLDEYRLRADTGTPLDQPVHEGNFR